MLIRNIASVALVAVVGAAGGASAAPQGGGGLELRQAREPAPLSGLPPDRDTGLRLLAADNPPFVLDVDGGAVAPVSDLPALERGSVVSVVGVGGRAAVIAAPAVSSRASFFAVRGREPRVSSLGSGLAVAPAADGRSVWVESRIDRSRCTLRRVGLDGRVLRAPRRFPCASTLQAGGSLGLVVDRTRIVDPVTGRTVLTTRRGIVAVAGRKLVLAGPVGPLALVDARTGAERRLGWPGFGGLGQPAVDPRGRFVVLEFADPSWNLTGKQVLDEWLLDTRTGRLTQLPGMPALVSLKRTSTAWTADGRLVLLAESGGRDLVAVWRPGRPRLAVKAVRLPRRTGGSDAFAPLG